MDFKKLLRLNEDVNLSIKTQQKADDDKAPKNYGEYVSKQVQSMVQNKADFTKANDNDIKQMGKNMATVAKSKFKGLNGLPKNDNEASNILQSEIAKQQMDAAGDGEETDASIQAQKEIDDFTKKIQENVIDSLSFAACKMILNESFKDVNFDYDSIVSKLDKCFKQFLNYSDTLDKKSEKTFEEVFNKEFNDLNIKFDVKYGRSADAERNGLVDSAYHDPKTDTITVFIGYGFIGQYLGYREDLGRNRYELALTHIATTIIHEMAHKYQHSKFRNRSAKDMYDVDKEHFDINEWKKSKDEIGAQAVEYANVFNNNDYVPTGTFGGVVFRKFLLYQYDDKLRHDLIKKIFPLLNNRGKKSFDDFYKRYTEYCKKHPGGYEL